MNCRKANQKCVENEKKCNCLEGYQDGDNKDGNHCKCVTDWSELKNGGGTREDICQSCTPGYEKKIWSSTIANKKWCRRETRECKRTEEEQKAINNYPFSIAILKVRLKTKQSWPGCTQLL